VVRSNSECWSVSRGPAFSFWATELKSPFLVVQDLQTLHLRTFVSSLSYLSLRVSVVYQYLNVRVSVVYHTYI
jgi:hypothetical protein